VPEYSGAREALKNGYVTRGDRTNAEYVHSLGPLDGEPESLLFDPQTSGGLLIGVASEHSESLLHALRVAGFEQTARIGHVEAGAGIRVVDGA
jgi:selenide,water dikinase